jgi:hypothetical protein
MGQIAFGLLAGVVVGLVMEWVIDWAGLLPRRAVDKPRSNRAATRHGPVGRTSRTEKVPVAPIDTDDNGSEAGGE